MNKEKYNQIIDEVYERYWNSIETSEYDGVGPISIELPTLTKEEFIDKIKTDNKFSEKWGLKIEERELSREERINYCIYVLGYEGVLDFGHSQNDDDKILDFLNYWKVPTIEISLTYNNKTINIYE